MIEKLLQTALNEIQAGHHVMLVAVVRSTGSTPRAAGALMLAGENGLLGGTVGGGLLEHRCLEIAAAQPAVPHRETFVLDNRQAGSLGMVCGGTSEILFTPLTGAAPLEAALDALRSRVAAWLCLPLDGAAPLVSQAPGLPKQPAVTELLGQAVLAVPLTKAERVFLIGGGHVSLELAALLHQLNFRYLVIDDRPAFCSPERFPHAERTLVAPLSALGKTLTGELTPAAADAFCIMTRGHAGDADATRFALQTPASYIGVMGSRRKRETMFAQLTAEGFSDARRRVVTPIGLHIDAQTPAEIAVSVAAQLISWRAAR
ncbi:MAG TPA: XdhC family protein [Candidatus Agathobaculum merdigallinarum]|nr:XdhC family protein [Candidatus Agathobaculum merdigallinarum]